MKGLVCCLVGSTVGEPRVVPIRYPIEQATAVGAGTRPDTLETAQIGSTDSCRLGTAESKHVNSGRRRCPDFSKRVPSMSADIC